jgi:hypothetical protein
MAELIDELLPASFLQRCIGGFLDMLADNAAEVSIPLGTSMVFQKECTC